MKTPTTYWLTFSGELIDNPEQRGYHELDCGPDMFLNVEGDYCERVDAFRIHMVAVDGACKPVVRSSPGKVVDYLREEGLLGDGGVSFDGIVRLNYISAHVVGLNRWREVSLINILRLARAQS